MIHLTQRPLEGTVAARAFAGAVLIGVGLLIGPGRAAHAQGADPGYVGDPASSNAGLPMPATGGAAPAQDTGVAATPAAGPRAVQAPATPPASQADSNAGFAVPAHQP